jgi:DNA-binding NarL/FixJ family response regulator
MTNTLYAPIRVVIADDHEIFREGFRVMLKKQPDIELIGEAEDGKELTEIVEKLSPDVVVTDIKMPKMDGIEVTKALSKSHPHIGIIALSMFDEDNLIIDMLEAGAKGYLLKNTHKQEIFEAIKTVYRDETYYCHHTSNKLAKMIAQSKFNPYKKMPKPEFSDRELDTIRLICQEFSNKEIAARLSLSIRTIEGYRDKILEKINARNTAGIVIYAIRSGVYKI